MAGPQRPWSGWRHELHALLQNGADARHPWTVMPRRLTALTFRRQAGQGAESLHAFNLAVHLVNGLLLFALTRRFGTTVALSALALWWLHPLQVEAVASISARTDLLMVTMILLTLLVAEWPGWAGVLVASVCAVGAIAAKETGVVVLGLLPLWRWWTRQRWSEAWLAWLAIVGSASAYAAWHLVPGRFLSTAAAPHGPFWYLAVQIAAVWRLLALIPWPFGFTIDHDFDVIGRPVALVALGLSLVLMAAAWRWRKRWPTLGFGVGWVTLALGPRFVVSQGEFLNEHQMYLPMLGVYIAAALGSAQIGAGWSTRATLRDGKDDTSRSSQSSSMDSHRSLQMASASGSASTIAASKDCLQPPEHESFGAVLCDMRCSRKSQAAHRLLSFRLHDALRPQPEECARLPFQRAVDGDRRAFALFRLSDIWPSLNYLTGGSAYADAL